MNEKNNEENFESQSNSDYQDEKERNSKKNRLRLYSILTVFSFITAGIFYYCSYNYYNLFLYFSGNSFFYDAFVIFAIIGVIFSILTAIILWKIKTIKKREKLQK